MRLGLLHLGQVEETTKMRSMRLGLLRLGLLHLGQFKPKKEKT